jgi:hypothetical protein
MLAGSRERARAESHGGRARGPGRGAHRPAAADALMTAPLAARRSPSPITAQGYLARVSPSACRSVGNHRSKCAAPSAPHARVPWTGQSVGGRGAERCTDYTTRSKHFLDRVDDRARMRSLSRVSRMFRPTPGPARFRPCLRRGCSAASAAGGRTCAEDARAPPLAQLSDCDLRDYIAANGLQASGGGALVQRAGHRAQRVGRFCASCVLRLAAKGGPRRPAGGAAAAAARPGRG